MAPRVFERPERKRSVSEELVDQAGAKTQLDPDDDGKKEPEGEDPNRNRPKPTGRKTAKELVKVRVEVLPEEVKLLGTEVFERIGDETSTTIERRVSSLVELTVVRPKFRAKTTEAETAVQQERVARGTKPSVAPAVCSGALSDGPQSDSRHDQ